MAPAQAARTTLQQMEEEVAALPQKHYGAQALNAEQRGAVAAVLRQGGVLHPLFGPPGTGKTVSSRQLRALGSS